MALREHLFHKRATADAMFRWRGGEVSRLEGLSDGVFALTITLLVVSVEVPATFRELWLAVRDLPVFLACFTMLMLAWRYHYLFFRRYGLEDGLTSALNGAFLFLVLFYAYPLKFMATFLWRLVLGVDRSSMFAVPPGVEWMSDLGQRAGMMYFYGGGVIGVFGLLAVLVARAWARREELELDEVEAHLTVASIRSHLLTASVAALSIGVLLATGNPGLSGVVYFLMGPVHGLHGWWAGTRARRLLDAAAAREASSAQ